MIPRLLAALAIVGLTLIIPARAADSPAPAASPEAFVGGRAMPDRERQLIALFQESAATYRTARTAKLKTDIRLGAELRVTRYMHESQEASDWLGVVRGTRSTEEGDRSVSIEIAPDITLATFQNRFADRVELTLIHQYSALWKAVDQLHVGQLVLFSGRMQTLVVGDDDSIVLRPQIITRFTKITPLDQPN